MPLRWHRLLQDAITNYRLPSTYPTLPSSSTCNGSSSSCNIVLVLTHLIDMYFMEFFLSKVQCFLFILQPYLEEIKRTINGTIFDKFIER